jgi:anti-sigma factor RsiW
MPQCSELAPLLGAFNDGELEPHEMQEVARHLAHCTTCEETLAGYATLGRLLRDTSPVPPLDGFAQAVQGRVERLRPPLRTRLGRWIGELGERFGAGAGLAVAAAAAAMLAVVVITPFARNLIGAGNQAANVAAREVSTAVSEAVPAAETLAAAASGEPSTIISQLETSNPDVAVWSEPIQDTTVIWLPDQQP